MIQNSRYQEELETAVKAARKSCKAMEDRKEEIEIKERKESYNDVLTEIDEKCQEIIEDTLMEKFPEDGFKAEEMKKAQRKERMWIVDPIDGTTNYLKGFEYYCTSIALKVNDQVKVGVVMSPASALGRLWFAVEGEGAYMSREKMITESQHIKVSDQGSIEGALITSKRKKEVEGQPLYDSKVNARLVDNDAMIRIIDAGALSCARIAEGIFDGFISCIENEWDYIAGKLLVKESCGSIRDDKSHLNNRSHVIASNGRIQEELESVADHHLQDI